MPEVLVRVHVVGVELGRRVRAHRHGREAVVGSVTVDEIEREAAQLVELRGREPLPSAQGARRGGGGPFRRRWRRLPGGWLTPDTACAGEEAGDPLLYG